MFIARPYWYALSPDTWRDHVRRLPSHELADVRAALAKTVAAAAADTEKLAVIERELATRVRHEPK